MTNVLDSHVAVGGRTHSRPLRIAMVAPPWFELPPVGYGGIESVVADLVDELTSRGHEITVIGAGRDLTRAAHFVPVFASPPSARLGEPLPEVIHAAGAAAALEDLDVDVVHDHTLAGPLLAAGRDIPTVVTVHGPAVGDMGDYYDRLGASVGLVAISRSQRRSNPALNWIGTVHNAIDVSSFPYRAHKGDYVLWLGRFSPDKGADVAIDAAREAGLSIVLAGKCGEPAEQAYFDQKIAPRLGSDARYVGEADADLKRELLGGARALIFPIQWEEPFGMVMIEAMACGTPVVALSRGSVPEVVAHEQTGLIVHHASELADALRHVGQINPASCRRHVLSHFDLSVMTRGYEQVYRDLVEQTGSLERAGTQRQNTVTAASSRRTVA